jgi:hypothetical protein
LRRFLEFRPGKPSRQQASRHDSLLVVLPAWLHASRRTGRQVILLATLPVGMPAGKLDSLADVVLAFGLYFCYTSWR